MVRSQVLIAVLLLLTAGAFGASDILRKVIAKSCSSSYTMGCFKMDMIQLMDLLENSGRYRLLPGVEITLDNNTEVAKSKKLPEKLVRSLARNFPNGDSAELDDYLVSRVSEYVNTHSLTFHLRDSKNGENSENEENTATQGRKGNKGGYGGIVAAAMMMKGMLATLGMGALAALAGKALMTGLMSLMLSAIIGLKSATGGSHKQTTYEIISKPVYSHSHSHSSEVQHDHGGGGHAGYAYGRNLDVQESKNGDKVTRTSEIQYVNLDDKDEEDQVEYKTITEDDLKKYGSYYANNIDYAALSGGTQTHQAQPAAGYRNAKALTQPIPRLLNPSATPNGEKKQ